MGNRLSKSLLARNDEVIGFDNLNDYYAIAHKDRHLSDLLPQKNFTFIKGDLRDAPLAPRSIPPTQTRRRRPSGRHGRRAATASSIR